MRQTIWLSKALRLWICAICALLIIAVYPLRMFRREVTFGDTGEARMIANTPYNTVNDEHVIRQYFRAHYDKIGSVSVYVSSLEGGRYMAVALQKEGYSSLCSRYIDLGEETLPGYVTVDLGVALEPGEKYTLLLKGKMSSFCVAYEPSGQGAVPGMEAFLNDWTPLGGARLAFLLNYDVPLSKSTSLVLMTVFFLAAVALNFLIKAFFRKKDKSDRLLMVGDVVFYPLAVLVTAGIAALLIMNFPLRIFDDNPLEVTFYAVGLVICGILALYAFRRICTEERREDDLRGVEWISAGLLALAIRYACDYMNGTYDLAHYISVRQMMICLLFMSLTLFPPRVLRNKAVLLTAAVSAVTAFIWSDSALLPPEEKLAELINTQTRLTAAVAAVGVTLIVCLLTQFFLVRQKKIPKATENSLFNGNRRLPLYLLLTIVTGGGMFLFRNTREWIPAFVFLYLLLFLSARRKIYSGRWFIIVRDGVYLHFYGAMIYCLLHRAFQTFVFNRYGFVFSTVTVTAEYLTMVCAVAAAGLYNRLATLEKRDPLTIIKTAWREMIIWGTATTYMIFTISRSSTVAVGFLVVLLFIVMICAYPKAEDKQAKRISRGAFGLVICICTALSIIIIFPAAFTLQRMMPALRGAHEVLPGIEEVTGYPFYEDNLQTPPFILGRTKPDSAGYIRIKKFVHLFHNRILGGPDIFDWYYFDPQNYDEDGFLKYWFNGAELPEWYQNLIHDQRQEAADESQADANHSETIDSNAVVTGDAEVNESAFEQSETPEEETFAEEVSEEPQEALPAVQAEATDISNGRFEVYRSYLENLNMTGHPEMADENTVSSHAHNIYLQMAFDCGIPVGILFFAWIGFTIIGALIGYVKSAGNAEPKERTQAKSCVMMLAISVGFAVVGMFDWAFHLGNPSTVIFMTGIAPLVVCNGKKRR